MLPHYNSFPHNSNQVHVNGSSAPSHQIQPQLGIKNNQVPIPFSNANAHLSNGHGGAMPNMPPSMIAQPNFMGVPNNLHPMQSNHLGMPQFGSVGPTSQPGQPHVGFFSSQNSAHSMNSVASFPLHGQFCNLVQNVNQAVSSQPPGQLLGHNLLKLPQQINQNMGLPYGQFCLPNPLQNMNQFVQMQMHNPSQLGPNYAFAGLNQAPQATVSQNSPFFATHQFGNVHSNQAGQQVNQNQQNLVLPAMQGTQAGQQVNQNQQNSVLPAKQGTQFFQGNHTNTGGVYSSNTNWKHSPSKSFTKHPKRGVQPQGGFQNSQFHHMKNAKGKFAFPNGNKGKGLINESKGKFTNQGGEGKRSLSLPYTEQEIQRWREERRRHYPSKSNIEKKLSEKLINSEVIEREAKMRREQLKEILTKQAELGVEVAEIPSYYLEDSNQGHRREDNKSFTKKGRLPNNFGKREKYDKKDRFAKRQKSHHKGSSNDPSFSKREPTLLQKLLSADIKRDRSRLLQVFRFMVTNSFFKDCPDKPLKFPMVAVKESGCNEDMAEELSSLAAKDASKGSDNSMVEIIHNNDYEYHNDVCNYDDGGDEDDEEEEGKFTRTVQMLRTISLSRSTLRSFSQTRTHLCSNPSQTPSPRSTPSILISYSFYSTSSKQEKEDKNDVASFFNRDPTVPPKLFVVQPRLRPDNYLQAKLNEALCLANSLEEQRDGYFDVDFFDKEIPPHIVVQNPIVRHQTRADTYFGKGTLEVVKCHLNALEEKGEVDAIFVNTILSGIQQRNLEKILGKPVLDRVGLIIEIFNAHACTKEGKLQAELAALMYKKTRLVRLRGKSGRSTFGTDGEAEVVSARGRGSGGRGFISGAGETELQLQRRRISERRSSLLLQIQEVRRTRAVQRAGRKNRGGSYGQGLPTVAVVGYTNAGKSTLVSALSNSDLYSDSRLFATVDPKLRSVFLPSGKKVLVSDTVGFISDLPVQLVEAFHATLEEVVEADLLVHVLDCTAPNLNEHRSTVFQVLDQIGVSKEKLENMIEVWNKIDYQEEGMHFDECVDDIEDGEASSFSGEKDDMDSELSSGAENDEAFEAIDDQEGDYSDGWLASEDVEDPWGEGGSCTGLKTIDDQQSECPKDWTTEKQLQLQVQSGPHVRTSALMGVGLQELLELIDEKLKEAPKANVVERDPFDRKWRPPRTEEAGVAVEQ